MGLSGGFLISRNEPVGPARNAPRLFPAALRLALHVEAVTAFRRAGQGRPAMDPPAFVLESPAAPRAIKPARPGSFFDGGHKSFYPHVRTSEGVGRMRPRPSWRVPVRQIRVFM
jgi:hypothetical protein